MSKNLKLFQKGISHFLKTSSQDPKNFAVVISLAEKSEIPAMPIRTILAQNESENYAGMAGSDMGLAVNGDIVNECAAMQLPTVVVNEVGFFHAYFTLLYNSFSKIPLSKTVTSTSRTTAWRNPS